MIRRSFPALIALGVIGAFLWTLFFLYEKSEARPIVYSTVQPLRRDIVKKVVAPGALVPRREITIKPRVSGVIEKLYVEPGQYVKEQALLAKIQIIPNMAGLNQAEAELRSARISFETAKKELERYQKLRQLSLVSETEFVQQELAFKLRQEESLAAEANLQIVREGASKKSGKVSTNLVRATVEGMILEVPVKEGGSVIEANNFNEGTTIAAVADMNDMIFQGRVDESEVGRLKEGMPVSITVGALGDERFDGKLEYIAPKGVAKDGTIEFEVRAAVTQKPGVFLRANYSANADIVLAERRRALALNESVVVYDGGQSFVEVATKPQSFERRSVTLGLSDDIWVEVEKGLEEDMRVKEQVSTAAPGPR